MRSVWVLPTLPRAEVEARLDGLGARTAGVRAGWVIDGVLSVDLQTEELFQGWTDDGIAEIVDVIGVRPPWGLMVDVSGAVFSEVFALLEALIEAGGYAVDGGPGVWTFAEIQADALRPDGRWFFANG